jgi:hypothetical protein
MPLTFTVISLVSATFPLPSTRSIFPVSVYDARRFIFSNRAACCSSLSSVSSSWLVGVATLATLAALPSTTSACAIVGTTAGKNVTAATKHKR